MSEKVGKIFPALAKVQEELDAIGKNQKGYGYNFRGIDDVLNAMHPLFKKHKIITTRRDIESAREVRTVVDKNGKEKQFIEVFIKAKYAFVSLEDGSEVVTEGFGEGQDTSGGDKASSMATSNSYKYVIFEMFNIATEEQKDSDQVTAETNSKTSFTKKSDKKEESKPTARGRGAKKESEMIITLDEAGVVSGDSTLGEKPVTEKKKADSGEKKSRGSFRRS